MSYYSFKLFILLETYDNSKKLVFLYYFVNQKFLMKCIGSFRAAWEICDPVYCSEHIYRLTCSAVMLTDIIVYKTNRRWM